MSIHLCSKDLSLIWVDDNDTVWNNVSTEEKKKSILTVNEMENQNKNTPTTQERRRHNGCFNSLYVSSIVVSSNCTESKLY